MIPSVAMPSMARVVNSIIPAHNSLAFLSAARPTAAMTTAAMIVRIDKRRMICPPSVSVSIAHADGEALDSSDDHAARKPSQNSRRLRVASGPSKCSTEGPCRLGVAPTRDSDRERLESLSQPVGVWLTNGLPRTPMYLPEQSKGLIMSDPSVSEPSRPGSSKKPISPARKIIGAVALVALVGVAWLEDQRCWGTIPL